MIDIAKSRFSELLLFAEFTFRFHDSVLLDNALYINNGTGLELANVQPSNSGKYTCRANNAERAILSTAATLSVKGNPIRHLLELSKLC